jgi:hypothetical protein
MQDPVGGLVKHADLVCVYLRAITLFPLVALVAWMAKMGGWEVAVLQTLFLLYAYRQGYVERKLKELEAYEAYEAERARRNDLGDSNEIDRGNARRDEDGSER